LCYLDVENLCDNGSISSLLVLCNFCITLKPCYNYNASLTYDEATTCDNEEDMTMCYEPTTRNLLI